MESIVTLSNITKIFNAKIVAVSNLSYNFEKGKFYAIRGASGSGKSTLLQIIGTLDLPSKGTVYIDSHDITTLKDNEKAIIRRDNIGFIFQSFMLNPKLKAYENVILPMLSCKKDFSECEKYAIELLNMLGLEERTNHYPYQLSGGEQQRVSFARAIANKPGIILADEPTGSLDTANETVLLKKFKALSESGVCVIIVTHNDKIFDYADEVLTLSKGTIINVWNREG